MRAAEHPRWRRAATYLLAVAACAAAVAGPVLLDRPEGSPQPAPAPVPDGWIGGEGRSGPGADLEGSRSSADLDGDGAPDSVWLRSGGGRMAPLRVEALLSSRPDAVRWTLLDHQAMTGGIDGAVELDGDQGKELVVSSEDEEGFTRSVVQLVDGRLQQVARPTGGEDPFRGGDLVDGSSRAVRMVGEDLVTWTSRGRIRDDQEFARVDATWWRAREVAGTPTLVEDRTAEQCIDLFVGRFGDCRPNGEPDAALPEIGGENPGDVVPDFLPVAGETGPGQEVPFTAAEGEAVAWLGGTADRPILQVDAVGDRLAAPLGSGPVRLMDGSVAGERYDVVVVLRDGADGAVQGRAWTVRYGELVELPVSDEAPFGAGVQGSGAAERTYRTRLGASGLLWTELSTPDPQVREVWTWNLDEGPGLVASAAGCFRFPDDGSDVTYAERCCGAVSGRSTAGRGARDRPYVAGLSRR